MAKLKKPRIDEASSSISNSPQKISDSLFKLFEPALPAIISIDIIFFHGLQFEHNSDAYLSTWTRGGESQEVWPQTWLPEKYPGARILSVSYDAFIRTTGTEGMMDMYLIGENLLGEILWVRKNKEIEHCPIVLVGHSFGGLVIKQLCIHASQSEERSANGQDIGMFLKSIRGIFFYGTPHRGLEMNNAVVLKGSVMSSMPANKTLLAFVELLGKDAARLHEQFEQRWREYKWRIYGLGELHAMEGQRDPLVPEASSRFGDNYLTDESDHFSICRPVSRTSNRYLHLVDLINTVYVEKSRQPKVVLNVVGVESLQTEVQNHLKKHTFLGFCGMGGVGKTTMARVAFNTLSATFEYTCFVSEVKLIQGNKEEIKEKVWKNMRRHGQSVPGGTMADMWAEVTSKKLLVVFDDIETFEHAELLQEIADDNGSKESRFIITSRNAGVRGYFGVDRIYICDVPFLRYEFARELFITHAFAAGKDPPERLKHIMEDVVKGCAGLPLTLVVLGKYLGTITDDKIWNEVLDAVRNVEEIPNLDLEERVWRKLQLSYDALGDPEKHMFLDIASLLLVENPPFDFEEIRSAWSSMYRYPRTGWKTLVDRSLVQEEQVLEEKMFLSTNRNSGTRYVIARTYRKQWTTDHGGDRRKVKICMRIHMHEHLRRMGQRIAKMSSRYVSLIDDQWGENLIHPEKVVALSADISYLSHGSTGDSDIGQLDKSLCKLQKFFSQLKGLRYLSLTLRPFFSCERCKITGGFSLPSGLVLCKRCHITGGFSLPSGLVLLRWVGSNANLKLALEASFCKSLVVLTLFREDDCSLDILSSQACGYLSSLERLIITFPGLVRLSHTFGDLSRLEHLEINQCYVLKWLPETFENLSRLEHLEITRSRVLERLLETFGNLSRLEHLEHLEINECDVLEMNGDVLEINGCDVLERLPETFGNLSRLKHLEIKQCRVLERLPETFGNLSRLEHLEIHGCRVLQKLPETFGNLSRLKYLEINGCHVLERLSETFGNLSRLEHLEICACPVLERLPETFGNLSRLEHLEINGCPVLGRLPETFGNLSKLEHLKIHWCPVLERLPETFGNLSRLEHLEINWGYVLERLPETFGNLSRLKHLEINWCYVLERLPETFGNLSRLEHLEICACHVLKRLPETFGNLSRLEHLKISECYVLELPETFGNLGKLKHLDILSCRKLEGGPKTFENLSGWNTCI